MSWYRSPKWRPETRTSKLNGTHVTLSNQFYGTPTKQDSTAGRSRQKLDTWTSTAKLSVATVLTQSFQFVTHVVLTLWRAVSTKALRPTNATEDGTVNYHRVLVHNTNRRNIDARREQALGDQRNFETECQRVSHIRTFLRRSAFPTTDTELRLIAAAAKIGEIRMPKNGKRIPAATGTPEAL